MELVLGIDLGTSFSSAAAVRDGTLYVVEDEGGRRAMPSVVHYTPQGTITVGEAALRGMVEDPENTIHSAKRILGSRFGDPAVRIAQSAYLFKIIDGPNHWPLIKARSGSQAIPSVCAQILREVKTRSEKFFGEPIRKAVITVPAMANDAQRQQTKIAGKIAGLEVVGLLNEPTAAALAFSLMRVDGKTMAVYDFGGGTFDCSVIAWKQPNPKVLATHGDSFLGGDDVDLALAVYAAQEFQRQSGLDIRQRAADWKRLLLACERGKRELSHKTQATIRLPAVAQTASGTLDFNHTLDQKTLERVVAPLIHQTIELMLEAISMAGLTKNALDQVLLVGGSSRLPQVRRAVQRALRESIVPLLDIDPELAVAMGAAVEAQRLAGGRSSVIEIARNAVVEVVPSSFGLATAGGGFDPIIQKNSTLPASGKRSYTTWRDGQREMTFIVLQGNSTKASENVRLGDFVVSNLPAALAGKVNVELLFDVGADGLLRVTAKNTMTGEIHHLGIRVADVLTDELMGSK